MSQPTITVTTAPSGKTYLTTTNPFERRFNYHRAVKKGPFIFVSGTTALKTEEELQDRDQDQENSRSSLTQRMLQDMEDKVDSGMDEENIRVREYRGKSRVHACGSPHDQAVIAMRRCIDAVEGLDGRAGDVVRVRMFVGHSDYCDDVGNAFRKCFGATIEDGNGTGEIGAAATMIVVQNGFVDSDIAVEVEVDAVVM